MVESLRKSKFEQTTELRGNRYHRDGMSFKKKRARQHHFRQSSSLERLAKVSFTSSDEAEQLSEISDSLKEFELMYHESKVRLPAHLNNGAQTQFAMDPPFSFHTAEKHRKVPDEVEQIFVSNRKELMSDSASDSDGYDEDSFTLVKGYNQRIRAIYTYRLKEKVLEGLAYHTSRQ